MKTTHKEIRKVTVNLPADLLDDIMHDRGKGVTQTLTDLLREEKQRCVYRALMELRGSLVLDAPFDWKKMKKELRGEDRDLTRFLKPMS